jgi:hypothetical protein
MRDDLPKTLCDADYGGFGNDAEMDLRSICKGKFIEKLFLNFNFPHFLSVSKRCSSVQFAKQP